MSSAIPLCHAAYRVYTTVLWLAAKGLIPPTPLKKEGTGIKVPLLKGDLGGSCNPLPSCLKSVYTVGHVPRGGNGIEDLFSL